MYCTVMALEFYARTYVIARYDSTQIVGRMSVGVCRDSVGDSVATKRLHLHPGTLLHPRAVQVCVECVCALVPTRSVCEHASASTCGTVELKMSTVAY
eukprot:m.349930 g.349930  ORF g.349930 m.349930 type:complete len:98 (+) comp27958_c1_seq4:1836-2129(+)